MKKHLIALALSQFMCTSALASPTMWHTLDQQRTKTQSAQRHYQLDHHALSSQLEKLTQAQTIELMLPLPNGELVEFIVRPSQVMAPELAGKYPGIKTFRGHEKGNPAHSGRFDFGPHGFYGVFNHQGQQVYLDPQPQSGEHHYRSYHDNSQALSKKAFKQHAPRKHKSDLHQRNLLEQAALNNTPQAIPNTQITYRIAVATTGEYARFHGGTKEKTLAAVVTMLNRINDVYERDLAIKFELVADNDKLLFLDPDTDPFANTDEDIDKISEQINTRIGADNYDIGHLVGTGGGGLAGFEVVCTELKAEGITGSETPTNDAFHIDYVAHEIGHQLGADHTFNGEAGACGGNRAENSAYEPGSGSTIMGYTGICDEQDLQPNSDPYFHIHSLDQMNRYARMSSGKNCGVHTERGNSRPEVNAGANYTIPARTPFTLTGSATSNTQDTLSYSWQQFNLGGASASKADDSIDDGKRPLFRAFNPHSAPQRTLPKMADVLSGQPSFGEAYATTTRKLDFRLVVRDGQGGVSDDAMQVSVVGNEQGFAVTLPDSSSQWRGNTQLVKWHTAGTERAPVSCENVDILLSKDGGKTFDIELAKRIPNSGQSEVKLSNISTEQARIQVKCHDNIFFAVNSGNFSVNADASGDVAPVITGHKPLSLTEDSSIQVKPDDLILAQAMKIDTLTLSGGQNYQITGTTITPASNFHGELNVPVKVSSGSLTSASFTLTVTVTPVNDAPEAQNDTYTLDFESKNNSLAVLDNDQDTDGDVLKISNVDYRGKGQVTISGSALVYTPAAGFSGTETFRYDIEDGQGGSDFATVTVTVKDNPNPDNGGGDKDDDDSGSFGPWAMLSALLLFGRRRRR
ncbi:reprolysin-like metallopeptidase [Pseudoalteromonas rubra]|uniref:Peptidase M12B domain-containing protein n=1 Tax=Pseudoalteromonas rubra TaxID=43658 RepID=A0A5S3X047_9GAMM|nr:zinc-dependent metalloprotease family protein [Pseudoalteromonas rubra]TMP37341.1 hypothetical protein CWB98_11475 [Pseudoalteromonas rubra]